MARCSECGAPVAEDARYCRACGARVEPGRNAELLFGPLHAPLFAGAGADAVAAPAPSPSLSLGQVTAAVGVVLAVLLAVVLYHGRPATTSPDAGGLPVMGVMGEPVTVGDTAWGVAFIDAQATFSGHTPRQGRFLVVGVVAGNRGTRAFTMDGRAAGLLDADTGTRYAPAFTTWGTPDEIRAWTSVPSYALTPANTVAGLLIFDVPATVAHPRLLVRDMAAGGEFTGAIDLEQNRRGGESSRTSGLLPAR